MNRETTTGNSAKCLVVHFRGEKGKPHDLCKSDYEKLKASGMLWEIYPDAPMTWDNAEAVGDSPDQRIVETKEIKDV